MPRFNSQSFNANHFKTRLWLGIGGAIAVLLLLLLLKLLLPWLLIIAGLWLLQRYRQQRQAFEKHLYNCFYECLQTHGNCISALDFAMAAHITGPQARTFLDARARDFFADFKPTDHGDILYTFQKTTRVSNDSAPRLQG